MKTDAIDKWHQHNGHLGQERTHTFSHQKYYNTTQKLVRLYCETCFVCMLRNPVIARQKGSRKPITNMFCEHFQIDLIDMHKLQKKNPYRVLMRWIRTIQQGWYMLSVYDGTHRKKACTCMDQPHTHTESRTCMGLFLYMNGTAALFSPSEKFQSCTNLIYIEKIKPN